MTLLGPPLRAMKPTLLLLLLVTVAGPLAAITFGPPSAVPITGIGGSQVQRITAGDFTGDGKLDLLVVMAGSDVADGFYALVYPGKGDGTFTAPISTPITGGLPVVGDFNGDGKLDLATVGLSNVGPNLSIAIFPGDGAGSFAPPLVTTIGIAGYIPLFSFASGDLNGDGIPDLVLGDSFNGTVSVLLGSHDGHFKPPYVYATVDDPTRIAVGDLNGDGIPDLAVSGGSFGGDVGIHIGRGDGTFRAALSKYADGLLGPIQIGDFNGDGLNDVVVTDIGEQGGAITLLNHQDRELDSRSFSPIGHYPRILAVADFDRDGVPDLLVTTPVQTMRGLGDGAFALPVSIDDGSVANQEARNGAGEFGVAVGDFNGDGLSDLAILEPDSLNSPTDHISIRLNRTQPVSAPAPLVIDPPAAGLPAGGVVRFTATPASVPTAWSVAGGGTIDPDGTYHAPSPLPQPDSIVVTATAGDGSGRSATAVVNPSRPILKLGDASGRAGDTVTVPLLLEDGAPPVTGMNIVVHFGTVLESPQDQGGTDGWALGGSGVLVTEDWTVPGGFRVAAVGSKPAQSPATLAAFPATIPPGTPPGRYPLTLSTWALTGADQKPLALISVGGTLTVLPGGLSVPPPASPPAGPPSPPPTAHLSIPDVTIEVGSHVRMPVRVDSGAVSVTGIQFDLLFTGGFHPSAPYRIGLGPVIDGFGSDGTVASSAPGTLTVEAAGTEPRNGPGALVTLDLFIPSDTAPGVYPMTVSGVRLTGANGESLLVVAQGGSLTISQVLLGDPLPIGKITIANATQVLQWAVKLGTPTAAQFKAADVNNDGAVDIKDVTLILRAIVNGTGF